METRKLISEEKKSVAFELDPKDIKKEKELASGSYGVVFFGMMQNKSVAIKQMDTDCEIVGSEIAMMKILTSLRIPNIVKLIGVITTNKEINIVMEYMPKGDLFGYISESKPLDWTARHSIMTDMNNGLSYMHSYRIVHRDIKPTNVLLDNDLNAKLTDFGFTKYIDDTVEGVGTIGFVAPEILKSQSHYLDKSDVFSLSIAFSIIANWDNDSYPQYSSEDPAISWFVRKGGRPTINQACPPSIAKLITLGWQQNIDDRCDTKHIKQALASEQVKDELTRFSPSI